MDYDNIDSQFGKFNCTCTHRMVLSYTKQVLTRGTLYIANSLVGVQVCSDIDSVRRFCLKGASMMSPIKPWASGLSCVVHVLLTILSNLCM